MIPLDSELLNSPERILEELNKTKQRINTLQALECTLTDELEQHLKDGRIKGIFKWKGISANRMQTTQKYLFSEQLRDQEAKYKAEIEKKKELEILDEKFTKKLDTKPFWRISVDK